MKKQSSELEKIVGNEIADKGLISKTYKQLMQQAQYQKNKQSNLKMGRRPKQTFLWKRHTAGQQTQEKKCSTSLIIREMQTESTMRYYLTLVKNSIIKKNLQKINVGEDVGKRQTSFIVSGKVNWYGHYGDHYEDFFTN